MAHEKTSSHYIRKDLDWKSGRICFMEKLLRHWDRLSKKGVGPSSMDAFKKQVSVMLRDMV